MKKIIIGILFSVTVLPAVAFAPPTAPIINVHDTQMIREQQFRRQEINDFNEVKEEKARFEKRLKNSNPAVKNTIIEKEPELIEDNGEIRIKY